MFGVKESLLAEIRKIEDPDRARELGFDGWFWDVEHDFVLARAGIAAAVRFRAGALPSRAA